jgi:hypothetical protein
MTPLCLRGCGSGFSFGTFSLSACRSICLFRFLLIGLL